ncbi:hypothetical protein D3C78_1882510 [compost metagenome]
MLQHQGIEPVDPALAGDGGNHSFLVTDGRFFQEATGVDVSEKTLMAEVLVQWQLSFRMERCHFGAGSCAARAAV